MAQRSEGLASKPKVLSIADTRSNNGAILPHWPEGVEVISVRDPLRAMALIGRENFDGIYVAAGHVDQALRLGRLQENERILEAMPDGVALLDNHSTILWANDTLLHWCHRNVVGDSFYTSLPNPEILGPDDSPFTTALATSKASSSTLRTSDSQYYHVHAAPIVDGAGPPQYLVVTVRNVTDETQQQQTLEAIYKAGRELSDLTPEEVVGMTVHQRVELLKSNILHFTKDLLKFDVVEIRLLDPKTNELKPLLSDGMDEEAARRKLWASPTENGVTGFVASCGKSYLCEDTENDPLYIQGVRGAKSSLTVPLIWHEQTIGTFNVESPQPHAFNNDDMRFLEIFCRDVAGSLNNLELLATQKANAAQQSVEAIHSKVALPIDEILNDIVNIVENNIGLDADVSARLLHILRNARDIKTVIQDVGRELAPAEAVPATGDEEHPKLVGKRVLVVDKDETVRGSAHTLLERYGCIVETATTGKEAAMLVRMSLRDAAYDLILCAMKLPDMSAHGLMCRLKEMMDPVPLILMSEVGWDPDHTLPNCRKSGLHPKAVLVKPFRVNQLFPVMECVLDATAGAQQTQNA